MDDSKKFDDLVDEREVVLHKKFASHEDAIRAMAMAGIMAAIETPKKMIVVSADNIGDIVVAWKNAGGCQAAHGHIESYGFKIIADADSDGKNFTMC